MTDCRLPLSSGRILIFLGGVSALAWAGMGTGAVDVARAQVADPKAGPAGAPTAEAVLRRTADFFKEARSIAVEVERVQKVGELTIRNTATFAIERPNRFAIRSVEGVPGVSVISDGKTLFTSISQLQKYTEAEAPASIGDLKGDPFAQSTVQGSLMGELLAADPYKELTEGVKSSKYAGLETLDGVKVHHLMFTQDQFDWEMWVAADGDPTLRRVVTDLTKALANMPGAAQFKNQKMELIANFKDWRIDAKLDEKTFVFQPPKGAEKVENFLAGLGGGREQRSPLLGESAPDVSLKLLEGGEFRLKDHRDARIVMLDFWATWCGPCVQELPILAEVAESYKDKGVVFCAVNQQEKPEQIRKFLEEKKLSFAVALDSDRAVGTSYHADAIPLLILIDKQGVVQAVHVGYNPAIKATLRKELDSLLAGTDLAKETLREAKAKAEAKAAEAKAEGMEQAWSVAGPYYSVATDSKGQTVVAIDRQGSCALLDRDGKTTGTFRLAGNTHTIARFARLADGSQGLIAFSTWGPSVLASRLDGTKLWEETGGQGIDDVWAADLDGDGIDEVIVGYNGDTGLHVFSSEGKRLWKRTDLVNVWHVTAGDLNGDGKLEVVTTSAQGKVHVSSPSDGQPLRTLDAGLYANMIRTVRGRSIPSSKGDVVLVCGRVAAGQAMVALGDEGKTLWTLDLPAGTQTCDSLSVSPEGTWAAAGLRGGRVCVVDIAHGRIVAQVSGQGLTPMTAWATRGDTTTPLLLVASGESVTAFQIKPVAATPENSRP